jgi:CheY-like chemotaxis protein
VGPAGSLDEAMRLAKAAIAADGLDAAILDINLGGQNSFPVADILAERGIPFIYATGYAEQPEARIAQAAALLRKPVRPPS